jgi:uncharacterized protein (TIGR02145 family)
VPSSSSAPPSSSSVESSSSVVAADNYDCSIYDCVTTAYLNQEMLAAGLYDEFLDTRDNKVYRTVKIGTQTWFAQSLAYNVGNASCGGNDTSCVAGRMYTWMQVMDISDSYKNVDASNVISSIHQGICPSGYHVPTNAEFQTLYNYVVSSISATSVTTELNSSNGWAAVTGTDSFGFSMLPENAVKAGNGRAAFWTASQVSAVRAYRWFKDYSYNSYSGYKFSNTISDEKFRTMQLRCLKN